MPSIKLTAPRYCAALILLLLFGLSNSTAFATDDSDQWVRVHHRADSPSLRAEDLRGRLADYDSFQWGRLNSDQIERLRARGLSITTERAPFELTLGGRTFDPLDLPVSSGKRAAEPDGEFHIVQFDGPIRRQWLQQLRGAGVEIVQPLHPFSYIVWTEPGRMESAAALPAVRWAGLMRAEWKVPPTQRLGEAGIVPTMALASAHADRRQLIEQLGEFAHVVKITRLNRHFLVLQLEADRRDYPMIAELAGIYTIQYIPPETGPRGEMSQQSIVGAIDGSGDVLPGYANWLNDTGYDGSGITVGVVDGRVLTTHVDLADRIAPCNGTNGSCDGSGSNDHGTHVAGAIAGTGATGTLLNGFLRGQGVAPGARIVTQRYQPFLGAGPGSMVPDGMLQIYQDSARSGVLLTNNSWGPTTTPQGYDIPTQQIDFISRDADPDTPGDQPVLAVWSIMNGYGDSSGDCAPSSLASPDEAKNLFAVGSTALQTSGGSQVGNIFRVSGNSAHGPACDGRRVPHIVAPGCSTDSTTNASDTAHSAAFCGTSMASPVVSGAVSVWAEKYIDDFGVNPSPALVKAVFTAAAQDLEGNPNADGGTMGHRPDRFQGYGRIDLETVMNHGLEVFMHDQETVFDATGQDWSVALTAVDPSEPIRIMLAWTDAPGHGLGGDSPAWVNDLDLSVDSDGDTYRGNVIGADGWSASGGSADGMNNLEGVFLSPAQHGGAVNVTVTASDLTGDALNPYDPGDPSQDFALACYNCIEGNPTYTIETAPQALEACIPESGSDGYDVDVTLDVLGSYSGSVSLAASGEPAGVTSDLSPESVAPPGSAVWTLNIASSASPGESLLTVEGNDGSIQNSAELSLTLNEYLGSAPGQLEPVDGAADLRLAPTFEWSAIPEVDEYRIQVATDSGFSSPVIDQTVADTRFTPATALSIGTEYFWRVQGSNPCGGDWSSVRSFTTRLEPVADLSATEFSFSVPAGLTDEESLQIGNDGTGNLTFEITTDEPAESGRGQYDPARDEVLQVPDFILPGEGSSSATVAGGIASIGQVVGFTFEGTVSGISGSATYASDMALEITPPGSTGYAVGGYQTGHPPWDFDGNGSTEDGTYSSTHIGAEVFGEEGAPDRGDWQLDFEHSWLMDMTWTDVTVTLHKLAPPYCGEPQASVDWITVTPSDGSVAAGETETATISVDTTGLDQGDYSAWICVATNDPNAAMVPVAVSLTVTDSVVDQLYRDRFEQGAP